MTSRKLVAAMVLGAFMVMSIAYWAIGRAGSRVQASRPECFSVEPEADVAWRLGLAATPQALLDLLGRAAGPEGEAAECRHEMIRAQVEADSAFIVGCSLLLVAFFVFAGSLRGSPRWIFALLAAGIPIAGIFAYADFHENREVLQAVHAASLDSLASMPRPERLFHFVAIKLGALALASLVLGILWTSPKVSRWVYLPKAGALLAGGALLVAIFSRGWLGPGAGMALVACWWIAGLCHAIAVAVSPKSV